jgi:hypothetical protein
MNSSVCMHHDRNTETTYVRTPLEMMSDHWPNFLIACIFNIVNNSYTISARIKSLIFQ